MEEFRVHCAESRQTSVHCSVSVQDHVTQVCSVQHIFLCCCDIFGRKVKRWFSHVNAMSGLFFEKACILGLFAIWPVWSKMKVKVLWVESESGYC